MADRNKRKKKSGNEYRKLKKKRQDEDTKARTHMDKYFLIPSDEKSEEQTREKCVTESVNPERPSSSSLLEETRCSTDLDPKLSALPILNSTLDEEIDNASQFINDQDASSDSDMDIEGTLTTDQIQISEKNESESRSDSSDDEASKE